MVLRRFSVPVSRTGLVGTEGNTLSQEGPIRDRSDG
jgi:hypothetical protein